MVRGSQESERLLEVGQRGVELQGVSDCSSTLIADAVAVEPQLGQRGVDLDKPREDGHQLVIHAVSREIPNLRRAGADRRQANCSDFVVVLLQAQRRDPF
eukprot:3920945-Prymnesium_polylepis.1